jgi:hypothetical protein
MANLDSGIYTSFFILCYEVFTVIWYIYLIYEVMKPMTLV